MIKYKLNVMIAIKLMIAGFRPQLNLIDLKKKSF